MYVGFMYEFGIKKYSIYFTWFEFQSIRFTDYITIYYAPDQYCLVFAVFEELLPATRISVIFARLWLFRIRICPFMIVSSPVVDSFQKQTNHSVG